MKNTGSKVRKILILTLTAVLVIGLYYFCSRREKDNNDKISANDPYSVIVSRDLELNYPSTPKAVVTFYSDILQQIYLDEYDDKQVEAMAKQARGLFDDELLALNQYDAYMANLKVEREVYSKAGRYISGYEVENGYNIEYLSYQGADYAKVNTKYYVREGGNLIYTYHEYTLREDEDGKWRILFWELSDEASMEE